MTKLRILDINVFIDSMFPFPHSLAQCGKKDDSKALVLALKVFTDF